MAAVQPPKMFLPLCLTADKLFFSSNAAHFPPSKHTSGDSPRRAQFTCMCPERLFPSAVWLIQMLIFVMRWQVRFPSDHSSNVGPVCASMRHSGTVTPESAKPSRCSFLEPQRASFCFFFFQACCLMWKSRFWLNCHCLVTFSHSGNPRLEEGWRL